MSKRSRLPGAQPRRGRYVKGGPPGSKVRPCLTCGAPFPSEGPHNRMCGPCRVASVSPYAPS
jgi:hypothetical protein